MYFCVFLGGFYLLKTHNCSVLCQGIDSLCKTVTNNAMCNVLTEHAECGAIIFLSYYGCLLNLNFYLYIYHFKFSCRSSSEWGRQTDSTIKGCVCSFSTNANKCWCQSKWWQVDSRGDQCFMNLSFTCLHFLVLECWFVKAKTSVDIILISVMVKTFLPSLQWEVLVQISSVWSPVCRALHFVISLGTEVPSLSPTSSQS